MATAATAARRDDRGSAPAGSTPIGVPSDRARSAAAPGAPDQQLQRRSTSRTPTGTRVESAAAACLQWRPVPAANSVSPGWGGSSVERARSRRRRSGRRRRRAPPARPGGSSRTGRPTAPRCARPPDGARLRSGRAAPTPGRRRMTQRELTAEVVAVVERQVEPRPAAWRHPVRGVADEEDRAAAPALGELRPRREGPRPLDPHRAGWAPPRRAGRAGRPGVVRRFGGRPRQPQQPAVGSDPSGRKAR